MALAVGPRAARLAHRVLGDGARVPRRRLRRARRRPRPRVPAPRERARAERGAPVPGRSRDAGCTTGCCGCRTRRCRSRPGTSSNCAMRSTGSAARRCSRSSPEPTTGCRSTTTSARSIRLPRSRRASARRCATPGATCGPEPAAPTTVSRSSAATRPLRSTPRWPTISDTPAALAVLHGLAGELNAAVSGGDADPAAVAAAADSLRDALWVLGLDTLDPGADAADVACRARRARGRSASARARAATSPRRTGSATRSRDTATWCATRHRDPSWCRAMPRPEREPRRRNEEPRDDVVYGVQPVREALRGQRRVREVVCTERTAEQPWLVEAAAAGARVDVVPVEVVTSLAGRPDHQGVAALCDPYPYADAFELLSGAHPLVVVLDGVTDPRNLGAIVRACDGAGADGLVLPRHGSAGVTSIVAKASAGAVEHVRIAMATNLAELLRRTKRPDLWSYAAEAEGGRRAVGDRHHVRDAARARVRGVRNPATRTAAVRCRGDDPAGGTDRVPECRRCGGNAAVRGRAPACSRVRLAKAQHRVRLEG